MRPGTGMLLLQDAIRTTSAGGECAFFLQIAAVDRFLYCLHHKESHTLGRDEDLGITHRYYYVTHKLESHIV